MSKVQKLVGKVSDIKGVNPCQLVSCLLMIFKKIYCLTFKFISI